MPNLCPNGISSYNYIDDNDYLPKFAAMILSDKKGVQHIVLALAALGLKEVVIAPGSRNAPLVVSFNRHPSFNCTSIRDERSAGFFAFGKALELKEPVALICTSGSAALSFAPAIAEAYYQRIPLVVLTADRPKVWTNQGDGQTINQTEVYRNFIRNSYELNGDAQSREELWDIERKISEGWNKATVADCGPVHYNIPLKEPLYNVATIEPFQPKTFNTLIPHSAIPEEKIRALSKVIQESKKVMILVGQNYPDKELETLLAKAATQSNTVVLAESTSNIHHPDFIENIDRCITNLSEEAIKALMPDLLITIGGAIISKRIKTILRNHRPVAHWNIHPHDAYMDTYQSLTCSVFMNPIAFLKQILDKLHENNLSSSYKSQWLQLKAAQENKHQYFAQTAAYSDFKAFDEIYRLIPNNLSVHISNSSPIRYAQLFNNSNIKEMWGNRGTSGIDGSTSTVVGAAAAHPEKDFLLISGDVAFHYDINALWNEENINNLKIIVLNNGGGNIFRIIDGPNKVAERSQFLETAMQSNLEDMAKHYGWQYLSIKSTEELSDKLKDFFKKETHKTILEIFTDSEQSPKVLKDYWEALK